MHPAPSYELATARIADLHRRAQRDALARAAARAIQRAAADRNRIPASLRRVGQPRRFSKQLWTLLHAQVLLNGPAAAAGSPSLAEDGHRRFAARRTAR